MFSILFGRRLRQRSAMEEAYLAVQKILWLCSLLSFARIANMLTFAECRYMEYHPVTLTAPASRLHD